MVPLIVFISVLSNGDGSSFGNESEREGKKSKRSEELSREEREREREVKNEREVTGGEIVRVASERI